MTILLHENGVPRLVAADPAEPLLWALREDLGLSGSKFGCGARLCGACTVHADGEAVWSCQISIADIAAIRITTIEHVARTDAGKRVTASRLALDLPQCGFCQAGQIMAASSSSSSLLARNARPTGADIDAAMSGNICRCTAQVRIRVAIKRSAGATA